jgi:hypothetical protein
VAFTGRLTSAATGESIPYAGHFTRTQNFVAGTVTTTGLTRSTVIPGVGRLTLAAGREEVPADASDGRSRATTPWARTTEDVCRLLA